MLQVQTTKTDPAKFSRCEEQRQILDRGKSISPAQKLDTEIKERIYQALWKDAVIRALEYFEIDIHVKNGIVHLSGHIVNSASQNRVEKAIQGIPGVLGVRNDLILDEKLTVDVASSLGSLEHVYSCKFFTGASHGVISLNGRVNNFNVRSLAERCAADNPNVRGVINNIQVSGARQAALGLSFLQPVIGETVYFRDGVSGIVKQVIINPNNRLVIAMVLQGWFIDQNFSSTNREGVRPPEQLIVVAMKTVRYLTASSGFLYINSYERNQFMDFDSGGFVEPHNDWKPPYPYCKENVLFPIRYQAGSEQLASESPLNPFETMLEEQPSGEEPANDSPGG
jgi:osmotically-inducible protein OsmY